MRRRAVLLGAVGVGLGAAAPHAQPAPRTVIGWLSVARHPFIAPFRHRLSELGHEEGRTLTIIERYADGDTRRLPDAIHELRARRVDMLVVSGSDAAESAIRTVTDMAIVFAASGGYDVAGPVNFARPGRNLTGVVLQFDDVAQKWPELLKQAAPAVRRVAIVHDLSPSNTLQHAIAERAARSIGLQTVSLRIDGAGTLPERLKQARGDGSNGFIFVSSPVFTAAARPIVHQVAELAAPAIYESRVMPVNGGLMSFGPSFEEVFRLLADSVDRIARGARPGDVPIQRPTRFELVINLQTARILGLELPSLLLTRADEVIE